MRLILFQANLEEHWPVFSGDIQVAADFILSDAIKHFRIAGAQCSQIDPTKNLAKLRVDAHYTVVTQDVCKNFALDVLEFIQVEQRCIAIINKDCLKHLEVNRVEKPNTVCSVAHDQ